MTEHTSGNDSARLWQEVDLYFEHMLLPADSALAHAQENAQAGGLPAISVSSLQGKFLALLAKAMGARRILEIGTLGGYSTIWLGRSLPNDGQLVTLEIDPKHAAVANANLARAGLSSQVEVRLGPALESLTMLARAGAEPFDFVFIDADKPNIPAYFDWAVKLARRGAVIVVDNVVRNGEVINGASSDNGVPGIRALIAGLSSDPRVETTVIQTVGSKGHDGFLMAVVK
jgi:predicted O-methyltransferase YrrM